MELVTANNDETEDFRSKPRWCAGKKMEVSRVKFLGQIR